MFIKGLTFLLHIGGLSSLALFIGGYSQSKGNLVQKKKKTFNLMEAGADTCIADT